MSDILSLCDTKICESISKNVINICLNCRSASIKCKKCSEPYFVITLTYKTENFTDEMLEQFTNLINDRHTTIEIDKFYKNTIQDIVELQKILKLRMNYNLNLIKNFDEFKKNYNFSCENPMFSYPDELHILDSFYSETHYTSIKIYCHEELYLKFPKFNNISETSVYYSNYFKYL